MILLNYSHPLTPAQKSQVEALTGQAVEQVIDQPVQFDPDQPQQAAPDAKPAAPAQAAAPAAATAPTVATAPAAKEPPAPRPPRSVVIPSFSELPKPGDRFKGRVSDSDAEQIYLDIPGLEDALAVLRKADHQHFASLRTRKAILCQVVRLEEEKDNPGSWFVYCTSEE